MLLYRTRYVVKPYCYDLGLVWTCILLCPYGSRAHAESMCVLCEFTTTSKYAALFMFTRFHLASSWAHACTLGAHCRVMIALGKLYFQLLFAYPWHGYAASAFRTIQWYIIAVFSEYYRFIQLLLYCFYFLYSPIIVHTSVIIVSLHFVCTEITTRSDCITNKRLDKCTARIDDRNVNK